ncbi:branched-chain amino acid ABC transporter substrate-binding protein [Silicimonas algicola]|uniref:Amino acid/amide ABC transporter substrate-binding protein (HAAT family) n=1 Tax=Silicimonas algicola TaxID=1826607 RepID=A0A316G2E0_9RHOB|nr:ABC transporter substrate-binding protein [Silicimonas algicola]AZQ69098.1 branched-chain amino acid ABC transporter substrate-binding protein [Silicimonas algicola]PWK55101.1 amino acid/amide ABC transporter substrate-binding protein (HAAT family) [Silicimonas algicola]
MPFRIAQIVCLAVSMLVLAGEPAQAIDVRAAVLRVDYQVPLPISRFDLRPDDLGVAGGLLADEDNNTTGTFLGHTYATTTRAATPETADAAMDEILAEGLRYIVVIARMDDLLRLTDKAAEAGAMVFNAEAADMPLRDDQCRANLLHTATSYQQQADAVIQFAVWKKWTRLVLIAGSNTPDVALADAYRKAARKFGADIVEERIFEDIGGTRRTDSGHVLVQRQLPVFMQDLPEHDVVIAADASDYFAPYLTYHLWTPRPVMGSAGLRPVQMHGGHEAFGATQLQNRFEKIAVRYMKDEDYNTWIALRALGEAVTRTQSDDVTTVIDFLLSDAFELAGFKGHQVNFRDWNGQMRQEVILFDDRITVSVSPQEGFLHRTALQDTLGLDRPESACTALGQG